METTKLKLTKNQLLILFSTLITAIIHLSLNFPDTMFILNGLGFLALLVAYFVPLSMFKRYHSLIRGLFIAYTIVTILAWVAIGSRSTIGLITKLVEVVLLMALIASRKSS